MISILLSAFSCLIVAGCTPAIDNKLTVESISGQWVFEYKNCKERIQLNKNGSYVSMSKAEIQRGRWVLNGSVLSLSVKSDNALMSCFGEVIILLDRIKW